MMNAKNQILDPKTYWSELLIDLQKVANKTPFLDGADFPMVPELYGVGQEFCLELLQDPLYVRDFGSDVASYYAVIAANSFTAGIVAAYRWHMDFGNFSSLVEKLMEGNLEEQANNIMGFSHGDSEYRAFTSLVSSLLDQLFDRLEPYWELDDPRDYIFASMTAMFQLGSSIALSKLGF